MVADVGRAVTGGGVDATPEEQISHAPTLGPARDVLADRTQLIRPTGPAASSSSPSRTVAAANPSTMSGVVRALMKHGRMA